jgi:hypothetical protein
VLGGQFLQCAFWNHFDEIKQPERFFPSRLQMKINSAAVRKHFHHDSGNRHPQCNLPPTEPHRFQKWPRSARGWPASKNGSTKS